MSLLPVSPFLTFPSLYGRGYSLSTIEGYAICLEADVQWSPPTVNAEVGEVLLGAHGRAP
jgi:hypothetical protein